MGMLTVNGLQEYEDEEGGKERKGSYVRVKGDEKEEEEVENGRLLSRKRCRVDGEERVDLFTCRWCIDEIGGGRACLASLNPHHSQSGKVHLTRASATFSLPFSPSSSSILISLGV